MGRRRNIREVLDALEWARLERMRTGSPDFVRARVLEQSVQRLCDRMIAELPNGKAKHERRGREGSAEGAEKD